jgi:hypothetical protein
MTLDRVAMHFPELTIIGIHLGYPWTDEMISVCTKHPNVYMAGDAYAPKHWPQQAVHYANTYGQDKFLFGTDWAVIDPERAMNEMHDLAFRPRAAEEDSAEQRHQDFWPQRHAGMRSPIQDQHDLRPALAGRAAEWPPRPMPRSQAGARRLRASNRNLRPALAGRAAEWPPRPMPRSQAGGAGARRLRATL